VQNQNEHLVAPLPTIRRMPAYLRILRAVLATGAEVVSGTHIARKLQLEPIQVRKDFGFLGVTGKPRIGYEAKPLAAAIEALLGWDNTNAAFLVGAGRLGSALMGYEGFHRHGLEIVAAFDSDPSRVGEEINDVKILPMDKLMDLAQRMHVHIAVLTVPAPVAQEVTDMLVLGGIIGIWNFSPVTLTVPKNVVLQNEDLSRGLAELSVRVGGMLHSQEMSSS